MVTFRTTSLLLILASTFTGQSYAASCSASNAASAPSWYTEIMDSAKSLAGSMGGDDALGDIQDMLASQAGALLTNAVKIRKRAELHALDCTSSEECIKYEGGAYCADEKALTTRDEAGVTYSLSTGDYTLPDGTTGNLLLNPSPILSYIQAQPTKAAGTGTAASAATATSGSGGSGSLGSDEASAGSGSGAGPAATQAAGSGAEGLGIRMGMVAAVGIVAGVMVL